MPQKWTPAQMRKPRAYRVAAARKDTEARAAALGLTSSESDLVAFVPHGILGHVRKSQGSCG